MTSAAIKVLAGAAQRTPALANTSMAGWGRTHEQDLGLGYHPRHAALTPIGMLLKGAVQVGMGYGQAVAVMPDGQVYAWGLNNGDTLPLNVGPEGSWCGIWQYRQPGTVFAVQAQRSLEPGKTPAQIEAFERALEPPPRVADGRKGLIGQVVYIPGHVVTYNGGTWLCLRENCGVRPGTDASAWTTEGVQQVSQFYVPELEQWYVNAFNVGAPSRPAQLRHVASISMIGARGGAVLKDGSVVEWGRVTGLGAGGVNFNGSYGPKVRPLKPPPSHTVAFHGVLFRGALRGSLSTAAAITSLPVKALEAPYPAGYPVTLDDGAGHSDTFVVEAAAAEGAEAITVASHKPSFAFPSGTAVTSRLVTRLENIGEEHHRTAGQTASYLQVKKVETIILVRQVAKLSGTVAKGEERTTLPVTALQFPLAGGSQISTEGQTWTLSAPAVKGATVVGVLAQKARAEYGTNVVVQVLPNANTVLPENAQVLAAYAEQQIEAEGSSNGATTVALTMGTLVTQLVLKEVTRSIAVKDPVLLNDGAGHTQVFDAAVEAAAYGAATKYAAGEYVLEGGKMYESLKASNEGHTPSSSPTFWKEVSTIVLKVTPAWANSSYGAGTTVKAPTPYGSARRRLLSIELTQTPLQPFPGQLRAKKQPKEQPFWPVTEGPLQAAGWPMKPLIPPGVKCDAIALGTRGGSAPWTLAKTTDGKVLAWGSNGQGCIGAAGVMTPESIQFTPTYVVNPTSGTTPLEGIKAIACGETFAMALDTSGRVWVWGGVDRGIGGALVDLAGTTNVARPMQVPSLPGPGAEEVVAIAACASTAYALLANGKVLAWGRNEKGECCNGKVGGSEAGRWKSGHAYKAGNKAYYAGANYTCLLAVSSTTPPSGDATHWSFESRPNQVTPAEAVGLSGVVQIAGGRYHAAAVSSNGQLHTWGFNHEAQIGNGTLNDGPHSTPYLVDLEGHEALSVECGEWDTIALLKGLTGIRRPLDVKLEPQGELSGEQAAKVRLTWRSPEGNAGWVLKYVRSPTTFEEVILGAKIIEIENELLENELGEISLEAEEVKELEEELAELLVAQEEEKGGVAAALTPTEVAPGEYTATWEPPSASITPSIGYVLELKGPGAWEDAFVFTNGLWRSPFVL